jgi:prevent-host-death family protein
MIDTVMSLSEFKAQASRLLKELQEHPRPVVLTQNGRASAVLHDYAQYQRQQESLLMLKLMVQGEADVQQGDVSPQKAVFDDLRQRLEARQKE